MDNTSNARTDKKDRTVPRPNKARPRLDNPFVAPRTPVEEALVSIWAQVLKLDQVGIHDNFFDLGGNSLLANQVISRVISAFQVKVPLDALFRSPTAADMAVAIIQYQAERIDEEEVARIMAEIGKLPEERMEGFFEE